jgi:hypothetical protein
MRMTRDVITMAMTLVVGGGVTTTRHDFLEELPGHNGRFSVAPATYSFG